MAREIGLIARFGAAGVVNTGVGLAVIVLLDPVLGLAPALANAASYGVGVVVGFLLSRNFVFRSDGALPAAGLRYALAFVAAFALNQGVLYAAGRALGQGTFRHLAAQVLAMAVYSVVFYLTCRLWVFRARAEAAPE
jgi:putative flippase GtrA